jgi:uncharacterized Zn finger protein
MAGPEPLRSGRLLARTEAVLSVRRSGNLAVAMVRDRAEDLHKARLAVRTFGDADWGRAEEALAAEARYAAGLLAGAMPAGIEEVFAGIGLSLFPVRVHDLAMDCTCPDWQRPCAHLVAACHHLADAIDRDPFALLALRGRERDALLGEIRRLRPRSSPSGDARPATRPRWPRVERTSADGVTTRTPALGAAGRAPLPSSVAEFWTAPLPADGAAALDRAAPAVRPDVLLDLCGPLLVEPLGDLRDALRPLYDVLATRARVGS